MRTFALLRAAIAMLRRRATVLSLWPSNIADPRTDFPIDRMFVPSRAIAERSQTRNGAAVGATPSSIRNVKGSLT
jgi:hypothetical protein